MLSDQEVARVVRASAFAETLPFFRPGDTRVDSRNRVWVGRWLSTSDARRYDVFDEQGQLTASVRLPKGRTLLTLGRQSLYLVNVDEDGLQWIERYASPLER
jgi:sugar lactone lactonase YvrE